MLNRLCTFLALFALLLPAFVSAKAPEKKINKLLFMYRFYYLPFSMEFQEGKSSDEILPYILNSNGYPQRLITADELEQLDKEWNALKENYKKRSLLVSTPVPLNQSVRISQHIASHHIPVARTAFDGLSINDRISVTHLMQNKSPEVQANFKQLRYLKSMMGAADERKLNFFIISANWCDSCKEYRVLFETLMKNFPNADLNLHSVVIEDPKEQIFDSALLRELFPHPKMYSHDTIPRFIAYEEVDGKAVLFEEGAALQEVYNRFYKSQRGFLDNQITLFKKTRVLPNPLNPSLTSLMK